jgi:flagellin FlaB
MENMRDLFELLKKKDVGAIGIGAMIVFIALILVAGVAASVLIQTSNTVQLQAMKTGQDTMKEVAGGLAVYDIEGMVNKTTRINNMSYLAITVRPRPGSGDIDLNNTYILMSDGTKKVLLRYGYDISGLFVTKTGPSTANIFSWLTAANWGSVNNEKFAIAVMQDYDTSMTRFSPVMNRGDKAVLFIRCGGGTGGTNGTFGREIPVRTEVFGQIVPERGSPGGIAFTTPMSYSEIIYDLQ